MYNLYIDIDKDKYYSTIENLKKKNWISDNVIGFIRVGKLCFDIILEQCTLEECFFEICTFIYGLDTGYAEKDGVPYSDGEIICVPVDLVRDYDSFIECLSQKIEELLNDNREYKEYAEEKLIIW